MKFPNLDIELKQVQKIQLEILKEFDRICKKHNFKYQLLAGSLLGAVRHEGFIPWDDDIDVCLLREDYEKFMDICEKELGSEYFLQTYKTDKNYIMQFAKIRKNNTLFVENSFSNFDIHHGIFIDIFPLDNIKPNTIGGFFQQKIMYVLGRMNVARSKKICLNTNNPLAKITRLFGHYLVKIIPKSLLNNLQTRVACLFQNKNTKYVTHLTNGATKVRYKKYMLKKEDFYKSINGVFEELRVPIFENYHSVLTNLFGDYMKLPPNEERQPHHGIIEIKL